METVIAVVCVGAGLNLALWWALYYKLAVLPAALGAQARRERNEGEKRSMEVLQEAAAAKVGAITMSLRALEEQTSARHRDEVAAVEVRARVAERRASEVLPALGTALDLAHELRSMVDALSELELREHSQRTILPPPPDAVQSEARRAGAS